MSWRESFKRDLISYINENFQDNVVDIVYFKDESFETSCSTGTCDMEYALLYAMVVRSDDPEPKGEKYNISLVDFLSGIE